MLNTPNPVAAAESKKPKGIHQKTSKAKKLIPNDATASPRTGAGNSSTSIMADSGPFIAIVSGPRLARTVGEQTSSRCNGCERVTGRFRIVLGNFEPTRGESAKKKKTAPRKQRTWMHSSNLGIARSV